MADSQGAGNVQDTSGTSCHNTEQGSLSSTNLCCAKKNLSGQLKEISIGQIWINLNNSKSNNCNESKHIKHINIHETNN